MIHDLSFREHRLTEHSGYDAPHRDHSHESPSSSSSSDSSEERLDFAKRSSKRRRDTQDHERQETTEREAALKSIESRIGRRENLESTRLSLEERVARLNETRHAITTQLPEDVQLGCAYASTLDRADEYRIIGSEVAAISRWKTPAGTTARDTEVRASQGCANRVNLVMTAFGARSMRMEVQDDGFYSFDSIEGHEQSAGIIAAEWTTKDALESEREEDRFAFDQNLSRTDASRDRTPVPESLQEHVLLNEAMKKIMDKAPAGIAKTAWGKIVSLGRFKSDANGAVCFQVSPTVAAEFRRCAKGLFRPYQSRASKDPDGGYRVTMTQSQVDDLMREAELRTTPDASRCLILLNQKSNTIVESLSLEAQKRSLNLPNDASKAAMIADVLQREASRG